MKRLFLLTLLALWQLSASAQNLTITLPDTLVGKQWVKNYVRNVLKDQAAGEPGGVKDPDPVEPTTPSKEPCKTGPNLNAVYSVTDRSLIGQFHGEKVFEISWSIKDLAGNILRSGAVSPKDAQPLIRFDEPLPVGNYTLIYEGKNCSSPPSPFGFTVPRQGGEVVIPPTKPDPKPPVEGGGAAPDISTPGQLLTIAKGMDAHMKLTARDSAGVRLVSDLSADDRGDRYNYRYLIGSDIVTQDKPLKNYLLAGNNPIGFLKMKLRKDLNTINQWGTGQEGNNGYYKLDAGESFSHNTSYPFHTFFAKTAQAPAGFLNHVPQGYDPSRQQVQWADIAEDMQLPTGHFWINGWKPWGVDKVFAKGVTHLPHLSLPWNEADGNKQVVELKNAGKTYNDVPRLEAFLGLHPTGAEGLWPDGTSKSWWPNGAFDRETSIQKADQADVSDAIWIGETSENVSWQRDDADMWRHFYARLRQRYDERFKSRGISYEICHNYFWLGGESLVHNKGADYYKDIFKRTPEQLPQTVYSPGGTLSSTTMIVEAVYLNAPDLTLRQPLELIFRLAYFRHLGYNAGVFLFGQYETRPNNKLEIRYDDGTYFRNDKAPIDPGTHIANGFLSQVYGNLFCEWGGSTKVDGKNLDYRFLNGDWYPTGSTTPQGGFPHLWKHDGEIYFGYTGSTDLSYFGQRLYALTFGKTAGGQRQYLRFRVDGGSWITPDQTAINEVIDAYYQQRGFVLSETKNSATAWFYMNRYADNKPHILEVELPNGQIVKNTVAGGGIHAKVQ